MEAITSNDCLWASETQTHSSLPLAVATTATSSIKLGTSIAVALPHNDRAVGAPVLMSDAPSAGELDDGR